MRYTLCADLQDFFDSVRAHHLKGKVPNELLDRCLVDGAPRQGLPTSPALANVAAADMDKAVLRAARKAGYAIVYTRYADDIAISANDLAAIEWARKALPEIVGRCGFRLNPRKTRVMDQRYQRRIITGVALTDDGRAVPTRRARRALRAALHRAANSGPRSKWHLVAAGQKQWCQMKRPKASAAGQPQTPQGQTSTPKVDTQLVKQLCRHWGLRFPAGVPIPPKQEEWLRPNLVITGDPAYLLGPSQWGTSWTSCMRHHGSGRPYHRGAVCWLLLRGTRIAALLSERTRTDGVTRRQMRARCFVHELRDGRKCYDRIYAEAREAEETLRLALEQAGYVPCASCSGVKVVGQVPVSAVSRLPYLDNLHSLTATASSGPFAGRRVYVLRA
jgi:hypothetical protein